MLVEIGFALIVIAALVSAIFGLLPSRCPLCGGYDPSCEECGGWGLRKD